MDSLTQATLGAAIGEAMLGRKIGAKGAILGAVIASIPDLDVVILPFFDQLQRISIHRAYSHSILFSILGALLIMAILSRIKWTRNVSKIKLGLFVWLALITHMLLDAFTSYGTQLYLPFSDQRISFDSINIVDPVYTLPLLIGLILTLFIYRNKPFKSRFNTWGLVISSIYLIGTLGIKEYSKQKIGDQLRINNIEFHSLLTIPVGIGSINWYGVAKSDSSLHIGKYNLIGQNKIDFEYFPINEYLLEDLNPNTVNRLKWFSKGYYTVAQKDDKIRVYNMQCDMQGVRKFGEYKAPTAFYFEITKHDDGSEELTTGMHGLSE